LTTFRVDLEVYNGPLDLLLFLIRRDEVDIYDIPIARITEQYVHYAQLLAALDPNLAGDFLVMAATLMELKSQTLLPTPPPQEAVEEITDPRLELVRQLLEYKKFKDAAHLLGAAAQLQALKHARRPVLDPSLAVERDLDEVEVWELLDAFNRLVEQTGRRMKAHEVAYDDTPIALHAADVVDSLQRAGGSQRFEEIFEGRTKGELIGLFLALLELIRQRRIRAEQEQPFGPIIIHLLDAREIDPEVFDLDAETGAAAENVAEEMSEPRASGPSRDRQGAVFAAQEGPLLGECGPERASQPRSEAEALESPAAEAMGHLDEPELDDDAQ